MGFGWLFHGGKPMNCSFAPAAEEDVPQILEQGRALIRQYEDLSSLPAEEIFAWMERKTRRFLGEYRRILADGETAGWIRLHEEDGQLELDDLYLLPRFQNRGIGTWTLETILNEHPGPVFFYVFTGNTGAVRLYERLGFRVRERVSPTRQIMEKKNASSP